MKFSFNFFGSQEHRVFNYKPRHYDQDKEALKDMFGHVDGSGEKAPYVPGSHIQDSFRSGNYQKTKSATNKAQKIIGLVGMILFFIVLIFFVRFYGMLW